MWKVVCTLSILLVLSSLVEGINLVDLPLDQKQTICVKSTSFCLNTCNQLVKENTCDAATLQFSCVCSNGPLPVSIHFFPIQAQQCVYETQQCRDDCAVLHGANVDNMVMCSNLCDQHFNCGTPTAKETKNYFSQSTANSTKNMNNPQNVNDEKNSSTSLSKNVTLGLSYVVVVALSFLFAYMIM